MIEPRRTRVGRGAVASSLPAIALIVAISARASAAPSDSSAFRLELGGSTDFTNEQYYEYQDAFVDTTFLGTRRLVSTPESRVAAVLRATWLGTRRDGAARYELAHDLSVGDRLQRGSLAGQWVDEVAPEWRLSIGPRIEYRHDRTFDRDLDEWRGSALGRLRRTFGDGFSHAELGLGGDFLRSQGAGSDYLLDRNAARASLAWDRMPLFGPEWHAGGSTALRAFPDSSERDHVEHRFEWRTRVAGERGHSLQLEMDGGRRAALRSVATTRDRFMDLHGDLYGDLRLGERWALESGLGGEVVRYDDPDTAVFFDYEILRARLGPRFERDAWVVRVGPRGEIAFSDQSPGDVYREIAGAVEAEWFAGAAWWSVTPVAGWRDYSETPAGDSLSTSLHSSYAFYELGLIADQPLAGALRLRLFANGRYEKHTDPGQDARSLYFSIDVHRLF